MSKTDDNLMNKAMEQESEEKVLTIYKYEGEAPEAFTDHPSSVEITGTITAPKRFCEKRHDEFNSLKSHCLVSLSDGTMKLVINEQSSKNVYSINGKLEQAKQFVSLGINKEKGYQPKILSKKFKLLRSIFKDRSEHAKIVTALRNVEATVKQAFNNNDDQKGNVNVTFDQVVTSNIPDEFTLFMPVIEGEKPEKFKVEVILEANSAHEINCYLESVDAAEMIDKIIEERLQKEVEAIEEYTTVIYI
ncbi:hypothetical protein [Aquimarina macrocephali]|uniref:hypothetical protein n=1 Tax=Aquimarina macrocephali TaxID=666563 RepID=UPI003F678F27